MPITGPLKIAPAPTGNGNGNGNGGGGGKKWRAVGQAVSTDSTSAASVVSVIEGAVGAVSLLSTAAAQGSTPISLVATSASTLSTSAATGEAGQAEVPQAVSAGGHETLSTVDIGYLLTYDPIRLPLAAITSQSFSVSTSSKTSGNLVTPIGTRSSGASMASESRATGYTEDEVELMSIFALAA